MHSCIFNHRSSPCSNGLNILILRLLVQPFSGLFGEAASPPVMCTPALWHGWHLAIGFLIFTRCVPTPWIFACAGFSDVSDMDIYLRDPLQSWGPFLLRCLQRFWRGLWSGQRIFSIGHAQGGVSVPSNVMGDLQSCFWVFKCLTACLAAIISGGSWSPQSYFWFSAFSKVIRKNALRLRATYREVWFLPSIVLV